MILFSASPPPADIREHLLADYGGRYLEGVTLDAPDDVDQKPEGRSFPDPELCVDASDPRHYRVFKFSRDVPGSGFVPTGKAHTVVRGAGEWRRFLESLRRLDAIGRDTDESDTPETWATVQRLLDAGRIEQPGPAGQAG
jgi:hypothetical protein